ncbi:MAG: NUDIX domain-containing protein [Candidatus Gracilibacteria bacterium]|nr:NUDIX domain-containing protein [Candidatus Gracilibacteria bacterium]
MRATLAIIKDNKILLIHRFKDNMEYFVFPGGSVESHETAEMAAIREAKEETNFDIIISKKLFEHKDEFDSRLHHVFLVTEFSGDMALGGPEAEKNCENNRYILEWHDIDQIPDMLIHSDSIKERILENFGG